MRGARAKALRRAFIAQHGRAPAKTTYQGPRLFDFGPSSYRYVPSEWRRLKKAHRRATGNTAGVVLAAHRDEVRRLQKRDARKRRRAA